MRELLDTTLPDYPIDIPALAEAVQAARHARAAVFPKLAGLVANPTWDILLFLFIARERGEQVTVLTACASTFAPRATAIRHIGMCEQLGYLSRAADTVDRRRVYLSITPGGYDLMKNYFNQMPLRPMVRRAGRLRSQAASSTA